MALAMFDLDNTLIAHDSDYLWGEFMVTTGLVDAKIYQVKNDFFYQQYEAGRLDVHAYQKFCLEPLTHHTLEELKTLHDRFMGEYIRPVMLKKAHELIAYHRKQNDHIMIITSTNNFITGPIAEAFKVDVLLAIETEIKDNRYTGNIVGTPTFREGKVTRLMEWLKEHPEHSMEGSSFYSDSKNDVPLLEQVTHPIAVDPDSELQHIAEVRGWTIISLR